MKFISRGFLTISMLLIGNALADDCSIMKKVVNYLGEDMITKYGSTTDCCSFSGITCDGSKQITEIKIENIDLFGSDEAAAMNELSNLKSLTTLSFTNFLLSKGFPKNIGKIKSLKTLIFNRNSYYGSSIPDEIGDLINLEHLDLTDNNLSGKIPDTIGNLKKLRILNLSRNSLSGVIPYSMKNLENLVEVNFKSNFELEGYVPNIPNLVGCDYEFTNMCSLKSAKCKKGADECSQEDFKRYNQLNGNPNPNEEYKDEPKKSSGSSSSSSSSSTMTDEDKGIFDSFFDLFKTVLGIIISIPIIIIIIIIIVIITVVKKNRNRNKNRKQQKYNAMNGNNNINISNNNKYKPITDEYNINVSITETGNIVANNDVTACETINEALNAASTTLPTPEPTSNPSSSQIPIPMQLPKLEPEPDITLSNGNPTAPVANPNYSYNMNPNYSYPPPGTAYAAPVYGTAQPYAQPLYTNDGTVYTNQPYSVVPPQTVVQPTPTPNLNVTNNNYGDNIPPPPGAYNTNVASNNPPPYI